MCTGDYRPECSAADTRYGTFEAETAWKNKKWVENLEIRDLAFVEFSCVERLRDLVSVKN
jgi:hypothetical protein